MICNNLSEEEKRAKIISDLDSNMFVEAGAGAGKTTLIVTRIINQLKYNKVKPEELVVITFTNKAAEELFNRIIMEIRKNIEKTDGEEKKNLQNALNKIDLMTVSTIHSFCKKLICERAFDAKIPLDTRIIENEETEEIKKSYFEDWFVKNVDDELYREGSIVWQTENGKSSYVKNLRNVFYDITELPDDTNIVCYKDYLNYENEKIEERAEEILQSIYDKIIELINGIDGLDIESLDDGFDMDLFNKKHWINWYLKKDVTCLENVKNIYNKRDSSTGCLKMTKKKAIDKFIKDVNSELSDWLQINVYSKIDELSKIADCHKLAVILCPAVDAAKAYNNDRSDYRLLTNNDLLYIARKLVKNSKEARIYFKNKYKCIYVDEFQDTDHVQADMLWNLALEEGEENKLQKGALFVVGDPKQSIYGFRGAELSVYCNIKDKMSALDNALVFELDNNYRSNEKIIDWVNSSFEPVFKSMNNINNYNDMLCINKGCEDENNIVAGVYKYFSISDEKMKADDKKVLDAKNLSQIILKIKNNCKIMYTTSDKKRAVRNVNYSDFLILFSNKTGEDVYMPPGAALFRHKGIPLAHGEKHRLRRDYADGQYIDFFLNL